MPVPDQETARFLEAWMQVRQLVHASNFNRFQREGLSATQFMTLNVIPKEGITLSALARTLNLSAATLNETVNSLEERSLVKRKPDPADRRKVIIRATQKGTATQNAASHEFHAFIAGLFAKMTQTRRLGLLHGLEEMVALGRVNSENSAITRRDDDALPAKHSSPRSQRR